MGEISEIDSGSGRAKGRHSRGGPGDVHQEVVGAILAEQPAARTRGFVRMLKPLFDAHAENEGLPSGCRIRPDAFVIDAANQLVVAYEVEHGHRLDDRRWGEYVAIAWALDEICWALDLIVIDCVTGGQATFDVRKQDVLQIAGRGAAGAPTRPWAD